jgi:uncharacterized protein (TIGR01777 family)
MATVLVTGGTGLIGKKLSQMLVEKGYDVIVLSRQISEKKEQLSNVHYAAWNIENQSIDATAIANADYIIHLAGAGVADKRWTTQRKKEIVESRTKSSTLLVKALNETPNNVKAVISISAIGWYGPDTNESSAHGFTEDKNADTAFLGETCRLWEASIEPVKKLNKRLVKFRTGIVLSKDGGALKEFVKPLQTGIVTIFGSGKQMISWIHIDDLCHMFISAIENENINGTFNAVTPNPVSNKQLMYVLATQKNKYFLPLHIPAFILKLMLGEMSIELLKSVNVSAKKILSTGFEFLYPTIESALKKEVKGE